jgi:predicted Zn-dependent protease
MGLSRRSPRAGWVRRAPALGFVLALGCTSTVNPVTGQREYTTMSPQQEVEIGQQAATEVEQQMGYVQNPALQGYVAQLGDRLAAFSPRRDVRYSFHAVDMAETNAFALPGGYVYVSRGLLVLANGEDELAGVIGHEIGHVAARHSAQRQTRAQVAGIGTAVATIGAAILGGGPLAQSVAQLTQLPAQAWIASYSRDQERQSDEIGQKLAASAGYDPAGIATFLAALGKEEQVRSGEARRSSFLDSHPSSAERVASASARASRFPRAAASPIAATRSDFVRRMEGLLLGADPAQGVFRDNLFLHPEIDFALRFPRTWQTANTPRAVMAKPKQGNALIGFLGVPKAEGTDARTVARKMLADAQQQGLPGEDAGAARVGSARGHRIRLLVDGSKLVERTVFAHQGALYLMHAEATRSEWAAWEEDFTRTAASFRPLSGDDRALITEERLALVAAKRGETLEQVSKRSDNRWSAAETALANGLRGDERLEAGFLVKIAREQPYRSGN